MAHRRRLVWWVVLGISLLVAGSLAVLLASRSHQERQSGGGATHEVALDSAPAWQARADALFWPITGGLVQLLREGAAWRAGNRTDAQFSQVVSALIPAFVADTDKLAQLPTLTVAPRAKAFLIASAQLYIESLRVSEVAIEQHNDLRHQLDLSGQRLRTLGDRIYDRARVAVDPKALDSMTSGVVELHPPADVPNWADAGLAAGPPLAAVAPAGAQLPAEREPSRPEQPEAGWRQAVEAAGIPPASELVEAINGGRLDALGALADRLVDAARELGSVADPQGGPERATTVRLGLLVDAEAARVAQGATLLATDATRRETLLGVSRRLVVIGDGLWDPALPPRVRAPTDNPSLRRL